MHQTEIGQFAAYGSWSAPNIFEITYRQIGCSTEVEFILTFDGDTITVEESGVVGSYIYSGVMR